MENRLLSPFSPETHSPSLPPTTGGLPPLRLMTTPLPPPISSETHSPPVPLTIGGLPPLRLVTAPRPPLPPRPPHRLPRGKAQQQQRPTSSHIARNGKAKAWPETMQDPRDVDFSAPKLHKKKVVYRAQASGQLKGEPELVRREVPRSSGMVQKPHKRSLKSEPHTPPSDRGTPDSLPESGSTDEYRALRRKYMMLEEENFALDKALSMEDEEMKALEAEKLALLDELVVLEGLVEPSQLQSQRRP